MEKPFGWIMLSRSILDNEIWTSDEPFDRRSAWIDLILMANYEDKTFYTRRGTVVNVPRGSLFTSSQHLADRWHWSRGKVMRYTKSLIFLKMMTSKRTADGQLLTIVNYDKFQTPRTADDTSGGTSGGTSLGTRLNKYKEINKEKNSNAPKPIAERLEAIRRFAQMGGDEYDANSN